MISQGAGVVVNSSSTDAISSELIRPMYGASKAAINALTRSIATQYGRQGIRAVGVAPGVIITVGAREAVPPETLANDLVGHGCLLAAPTARVSFEREVDD